MKFIVLFKMKPVQLILLAFCFILYSTALRAAPIDGLRLYFTALEQSDKEMMSKSIDASDAYKKQFVKMVDVSSRLSVLAGLLNDKYEVAPQKQKGPTHYLPTLQKNLLTRQFKVNGDHAETIPIDQNEVPVVLIRKNGSWLLDLRRGQSDEELLKQAEVLGASYDAMTTLLNGLIQKIDTLDADKFSYEEAWRMVEIQMERKLKAISKK